MKQFVALSKHARQRILERHYRHLPTTAKTQLDLERACEDLLRNAEECKRHMNDQAFMLFMYEKYGYEKNFAFRTHKNMLFVVVDGVCTTVLDTNEHHMTRQLTKTPVWQRKGGELPQVNRT